MGNYAADNASSCPGSVPGDQSSYSPNGVDGVGSYGGGGGGGYKGGGSSNNFGGAGGSGYVTGSSTSMASATGVDPGGNLDPDYVAPFGQSGRYGSNGYASRIIIRY